VFRIISGPAGVSGRQVRCSDETHVSSHRPTTEQRDVGDLHQRHHPKDNVIITKVTHRDPKALAALRAISATISTASQHSLRTCNYTRISVGFRLEPSTANAHDGNPDSTAQRGEHIVKSVR